MSFPHAPPLYHVENNKAQDNPPLQYIPLLSGTVSDGRSVGKEQLIENVHDLARIYHEHTDQELDVSVVTCLNSDLELRSPYNLPEPHCYLLPKEKKKLTSLLLSTEEDIPPDFPVTCVDIDGFDLAEMEDGIDLDVLMNGLDDDDEDTLNILDEAFDDNDVVEVYCDVDLNYESTKRDTARKSTMGNRCSFNDDEYLTLGYKKLTYYPPTRFELSNYRILQMVHTELFTALGCPSLKQLEENKTVRIRPRGRRRGVRCKPQDDSETDTASEGLVSK